MKLATQYALTGGDDYELCFAARPGREADILNIAKQLQLPITRIGRVVPGSSIKVANEAGDPVAVELNGYQHFGSN